MTMDHVEDHFEDRAIISGIGQSEVGRRLNRTGIDLTIEGALRAIEDAGLEPSDIDGLATYPGAAGGGSLGFSGPGSPEVQDALRLRLNWHRGGIEGPAQMTAVIDAAAAVACGMARHVLAYRTVTEATEQGSGGRGGIGVPSGGGGGGGGVPKVGGTMQWNLPYRAYSAACWLALNAQRHFHEFGTTREQLAAIPLTERRNASRNPNAIYRDPLTMDDYMSARMITTPFCLYDCDVPADGCTAIVVSRADYAPDTPHPAVQFEAVGTALRGRPSWDQYEDASTMPARDAAAMLWERTDLKPSDVDVAELYDGFSFLTLTWLEALGFCGKGEGGPFIEGGHRIALDGQIPVNTHGGQLSAGRLHGFGFIHEAVTQLRGDGRDRQVTKPVEVAVVGNGGGPIAGCMLLSRRR